MGDLKKIEDVVRNVLAVYPETRNSDNILYGYVIQNYNPALLQASVKDYLRYFNDYRVPRFESVARCRRKLQEKNPQLRADEDVKKWRKENERRYFNYAKEFIDE